MSENAEDYILFEESVLISTPSPICGSNAGTSAGTCDIPSLGLESPSQRILLITNQLWTLFACWNGSTRRFHLRKKSSVNVQPESGRETGRAAWIAGLIKRGNIPTSISISTSASPSFSQMRRDPTGIQPRAKSMGETFLVCIHNISDSHPYAILRTSINNTASDIIKQIFAKTQMQRFEANEGDYVLVEELKEPLNEPSTSKHLGGKVELPRRQPIEY
uniref:Ras-associating domain-containing protein n=1 Tax=Ditylenchus dipsaci TaxID=166011 RepID=A0A915DR73_9BILA